MQWLEQRRRERRWWTASATVAVCGLLLGVVGVYPAVASGRTPHCSVMPVGDQLQVSWVDVPAGLQLVLMAETSDGWLEPVVSAGTVGAGPAGSARVPAIAGAVAYALHGASELDGVVWCDGSRLGSAAVAADGGDSTPTPIEKPTVEPTKEPTVKPVETTTQAPSATPTPVATGEPTTGPTPGPTTGPSPDPTVSPTASPTGAAVPTPTPVPPQAPIIRATVIEDCVAGAVTVEVTNDATVTTTVEVIINMRSTTTTVEPGATATVDEPLTGSGAYLVDVLVGGVSVLTRQGTANCAITPEGGELTATLDFSCADNRVRVTVVNQTIEPQALTLRLDGQTIPFVVPAFQSIREDFRLVEDQAFEISVIDSRGVSLAFARGVHDCVDAREVGRKRVDEVELMELPRTGANAFVLATAGLTLVAAGVLALGAASIRRRRIAEA